MTSPLTRRPSFEAYYEAVFGGAPEYAILNGPQPTPYEIALRFAGIMGCIPLNEKKEPVCEHGFYDATRDPEELRAFFPEGKKLNIGIPLFPIAWGPNWIEFLCAIDLDVKTTHKAWKRNTVPLKLTTNGWDTLEELANQGLRLNPECSFRTRNGGIQFLRRIRIYFHEVPGLEKLNPENLMILGKEDEFSAIGIKQRGKFYPGMEFRIGRCYSQIWGESPADPGSLGDGQYRWIGNIPQSIEEIPYAEEWVRDRFLAMARGEIDEPKEEPKARRPKKQSEPKERKIRETKAGHIRITEDTVDPLIRFIWDNLPWKAFTGDGFKFRCPAHEDDNPSANIDLGADGSLLVHDHKEPDPCSAEQILKAISPGLEVRHLFPKHRYEIAQRFGRKYDLVYLILEKFLRENPNGFRGTAEALHRLLTPMVPEYLRNTKAWPKNGQALSKRINLIAKKGVTFKGYKIVHQRSNGIRKLFIIPEDSREVRRVSEEIVARIKEGILRRKSEAETSQCRNDVLNIARVSYSLFPDPNLELTNLIPTRDNLKSRLIELNLGPISSNPRGINLIPTRDNLKSRLIELNLGLDSSNPRGINLIPRLNLSPNLGIDTSLGANLNPMTLSLGDNIFPCRDTHGLEFPDGIDSRDSITPADSSSELEFDDSKFARIEFGDRDQLEGKPGDCLMGNSDFVRRGKAANSDEKSPKGDKFFSAGWVPDEDENDDIPAAFGAYFPPALVADRINPGTYPSSKDASREIRMPPKDTLTDEQEKIIRAVEMDSMFRDELVSWRSPLKPWNLENPAKYPEAYAPVVEFVANLIGKYAPKASGPFLEELIRAGISGFALALNDEEKEFCAKEIQDLFLRDLCPL